MERTVWEDSKGISLIEIMIAIVLLMIVSLALMQTSLVGYQANLQNSLREEATRVADQKMNELRDTAFADLSTAASTTTVARSFRGFTMNYTVVTDPTVTVTANSKQVGVRVQWDYRGKTYDHSVTSIVGKP